MKFETTKEQDEKVKKFHPRCKKKILGAIGGGDFFTFMPTGLGMVVTFTCKCGKKLDLTDSDSW